MRSGVHLFKRTINSIDEVGSNVFTDGTHLQALTGTGLRYFQFNSQLVGAGTKFYGSLTYQFSLENIHAVSEFANLFDNYRISKVVIRITPRSSMVPTVVDGTVGAGTNLPPSSPIMHWYIDHDDIGGVTADESGLRSMRERTNYHQRRLIGAPFSIVIKPRTSGALSAAAEGSSAANYMLPRKYWLDLGILNSKHFGLKVIIESICPLATANLVVPFEMQTTYYMAFKGVR